MAEYEEAFLFLEPEAPAGGESAVLEHSGTRTRLVWAPDAATAAEVAAELAEGGVRLIELYRGFDLGSAAGVIEAVDGRAPVGMAAFAAGQSLPGQARRSVTILADENADPTSDRVIREHSGGGRTTVVSSGEADAVRVAEEFVADGTELVEICGGTPLTTAARVVAAIGGRVPVSLVSWSFESIDGVAAYKAAYAEAHPDGS